LETEHFVRDDAERMRFPVMCETYIPLEGLGMVSRSHCERRRDFVSLE
jgi:hypothetical protein